MHTPLHLVLFCPPYVCNAPSIIVFVNNRGAVQPEELWFRLFFDGTGREAGLPVFLQAQERDDQRDDCDQRARDHQVLDRLSPAVSCQQAVGRAISVSAGYPWDGTDVGMVYRTAWPSHHT